MSDCLSEKGIVDRSIEAATIYENDEVAAIETIEEEEEESDDVNALQEKMKYIHIFSDKYFQCAGKEENQKNHVETEEDDLHCVPKAWEAEEEQLLSIKIQKTKKKKSKYTSRKKVKLKFFN